MQSAEVLAEPPAEIFERQPAVDALHHPAVCVAGAGRDELGRHPGSGVPLATAYGVMMGALRLRSKGLLAPWVAHVAADLTIVAIRFVALR